jgi:hypothetical protein
MDPKYCSACLRKQPPSSSLRDTSAKIGSRVYATCIVCRGKSATKRKALRELDPNLPSKRCATGSKTRTAVPWTLESCPIRPSLLQSRPIPPSILESRRPPSIVEPRPNPTTLAESGPIRPRALEPRPDPAPQAPQPRPTPSENGFLSAEQWGWIQTSQGEPPGLSTHHHFTRPIRYSPCRRRRFPIVSICHSQSLGRRSPSPTRFGRECPSKFPVHGPKPQYYSHRDRPYPLRDFGT